MISVSSVIQDIQNYLAKNNREPGVIEVTSDQLKRLKEEIILMCRYPTSVNGDTVYIAGLKVGVKNEILRIP